MKQRVVIVTLAILISLIALAIYGGGTAVLVGIIALLMVELVAGFADCFKIVSFLNSGRGLTDFGQRIGPLRSMLGSVLGPAINQLFVAFSVREELHSGRLQAPEREVDLISVASTPAPLEGDTIPISEVEERKFYHKMLAAYANQFGADVVSIMYSATEGADIRAITVNRVEERLLVKMLNWASPYVIRGDNRLLGVHDKPVSGLTDFCGWSGEGFKSSVSYPITNGNARPWRSVLWLGYQSSSPGRAEIERARQVARRLGEDLMNFHRIRDLSEKAHSAEIQSQAKSDFIAHVSHDIRSPLNNVRSILSLFEEEANNAELRGLLGTARANCDTIGDIVEDILDFSRHQSGQLKPHPEPVEVAAVLDSVVGCFKFAAQAKGLLLSFENRVAAASHAIVDRRHLKRIFSNILSNAIKYTDSGGVKIELSGVKPHWKVKIIDTGHGMTPDQMERLFTPFTRFTEKVEGIGLGLAVTRILANANSVQIGVGSRVGDGSTFELVIPAAYEEEFALTEPSVSARAAAPQPYMMKQVRIESEVADRSAISVLLVDDDVDYTSTLARNLRKAGFKVLPLNSVPDALELLRFQEAGAIISDYDMPNGGGVRLIEEVRKLSQSIPLLILSGRDDPAITKQVRSLGADDTMVKPAEVQDIISWIERMVGGPWLAADAKYKKAG